MRDFEKVLPAIKAGDGLYFRPAKMAMVYNVIVSGAAEERLKGFDRELMAACGKMGAQV